ncbi:MAG: hypothetical protein F6J95_000330 [Leptolyngbya sp. SIO1E4]|nr:hypothetical protein [Leptolyngbya sp. SIO1E4]
MPVQYRPELLQDRLVCPRCGKSSVVLHGDSDYVCLDHQCGFRHDVAVGGRGGAAAGFLGILLAILVALAMI